MTDMAQIEKILFLREVNLFRYCTAGEVLGISNLADETHFEAGKTIYTPGDSAEYLFCVVSGEVVLEDKGVSRTLGTHDAFGHQDILSGRLRSCTARVTRDLHLIIVDAEDFFDLMANNIDIVKALFRQMLSEQKS